MILNFIDEYLFHLNVFRQSKDIKLFTKEGLI